MTMLLSVQFHGLFLGLKARHLASYKGKNKIIRNVQGVVYHQSLFLWKMRVHRQGKSINSEVSFMSQERPGDKHRTLQINPKGSSAGDSLLSFNLVNYIRTKMPYTALFVQKTNYNHYQITCYLTRNSQFNTIWKSTEKFQAAIIHVLDL